MGDAGTEESSPYCSQKTLETKKNKGKLNSIFLFFSLTTNSGGRECGFSSIALMIVMHISDVPVKTILTLDLVRAHRARKLRFDSTFVSLMLDKSAST